MLFLQSVYDRLSLMCHCLNVFCCILCCELSLSLLVCCSFCIFYLCPRRYVIFIFVSNPQYPRYAFLMVYSDFGECLFVCSLFVFCLVLCPTNQQKSSSCLSALSYCYSSSIFGANTACGQNFKSFWQTQTYIIHCISRKICYNQPCLIFICTILCQCGWAFDVYLIYFARSFALWTNYLYSCVTFQRYRTQNRWLYLP